MYQEYYVALQRNFAPWGGQQTQQKEGESDGPPQTTKITESHEHQQIMSPKALKAEKLRGQNIKELTTNVRGIPAPKPINSHIPSLSNSDDQDPKPVVCRHFNIRMRCSLL